jgi:hypothetical protein
LGLRQANHGYLELLLAGFEVDDEKTIALFETAKEPGGHYDLLDRQLQGLLTCANYVNHSYRLRNKLLRRF